MSVLVVLSTPVAPHVVVREFDSGSVLSMVLDSPRGAIVSSRKDPADTAATFSGEVGDDVPVPPIVQSFIDAYREGRTKDALAVIFDPLLKLVNDMPAKTAQETGDKDRLLDAVSTIRGMLRIKMSGQSGNSVLPKEIRVLRSFRSEAEKIRVHLLIRHDEYDYYMRLVSQVTPIGVIITNVGFGGKDTLGE